MQPVSHVYFRMRRFGREHVPAEGPVIFAANHRSFLDPFVIGMVTRRPIYYVAKKELFRTRGGGRLLGALGAFPVDRGTGDTEHVRDRAGDPRSAAGCVLMFPEGTRTRPGPARPPAARRRAARARDRRAGRPGRDRSAPTPCAAAGGSARTASTSAPGRR